MLINDDEPHYDHYDHNDVLNISEQELYIFTYKERLKGLISIYKNDNLIDAIDTQILMLRLGLEDGLCYTLIETGNILHMSSENIRRRQYVILRRKIRDPLFFLLLKNYSQHKQLPKGIQE